MMGVCEIDLCDLGQGEVEGFCEDCIYSLVSTKFGEYLGYVSNYKDPKKNAAP
jgi:hypothetical protein